MFIDRVNARLLGKIGFMGLWQGKFAESEEIFTALKANDPTRIGPVLGLGLAALHRGENEKAIEILEKEALAIDADDEHAKVWLALAYTRAGQTDKAKALLEPLNNDASLAEDAKIMAQNILEEIAATA